MKKSNLFLLIDALMFLFLALMSGLGLMIKYKLVPGSKRWEIYGRNVDLTFLGMDRHQWGTVHLIIAILFIGLLILHIILHWKTIMAYMHRLFNNNSEVNLVFTASAFILFFLIVFPFLTGVKVKELGDGRDRFIHQSGQHITPAAVQREQRKEQETTKEIRTKAPVEEVKKKTEEAEPEHHDIDTDIQVLGSMSLISVSLKYNVPVSHIVKELGLPSTTSGNEQLGKLRRSYGFKMSDIEMIIHNYRHGRH